MLLHNNDLCERHSFFLSKKKHIKNNIDLSLEELILLIAMRDHHHHDRKLSFSANILFKKKICEQTGFFSNEQK